MAGTKQVVDIVDIYSLSITQLISALTDVQSGISLVLIGARDAKQAAENAKAGLTQFSTEDITDLNEKVLSLKKLG